MPSRIGAAALRSYALACVFSWAGGSHARAQRSESLGSESLGSESYPRLYRSWGPYIDRRWLARTAPALLQARR